jgi:glucose-1-phosphate adenylyltransferase
MLTHKELSKRTLTFVLAGGKGERLAPLTTHCPKPAVQFGSSSRIIDFTLSNCVRSKLLQTFVLTQYKKERLHSYVHRAWRLRQGIDITCLPPATGKEYRGTADAVAQNMAMVRKLRPEFVLILSGDHIYEMNYEALLRHHVASGSDVTVSAYECAIDAARRFGVIQTAHGNRVAGFEEKPENPLSIANAPERALVNMGVYVFNIATLLELERESRFGSDFGKHVLPDLVASKDVGYFNVVHSDSMVSKYWRDVGTLDSYFEANMDMLSEGVSRIAPTAQIGSAKVSWTIVAEGAKIEAHSTVENSILLSGARIEHGSFIRNAIVSEDTVIPAYSRIGYDLQSDRERFRVTENGVVVVADPRQEGYSSIGQLATA